MSTSRIVMFTQTVLLVVALGYGYMQRMEADKQRALAVQSKQAAEESRLQAMEQQKIAEMQRALAMQNEMEAVRQQKIAEDALAKCRSK